MQKEKVTIGDVVKAFGIHEIAKHYALIPVDTKTRIGNSVYQNTRAELEAFEKLKKLCDNVDIDVKEQNKIVPEPVSAAYNEYIKVLCVDQVDGQSPNFIFETLERNFLKK